MKIKYEFANGETTEVEVSEEIGTIIVDSRRSESNGNRKQRYHCYSLDETVYEGADYADAHTPEDLFVTATENQRLSSAFSQLTETQRRRLLLLAEGMSLREIARRDGADIKTIRESVEGGRKKFRKVY